MKIIITGDISTRDKFKLTGFIDSFSNIDSDIEYLEPNKLINSYKCDILFGESGIWLDIDYTNIKNVFMWSVISIDKILNLSEKFKNTKFFICSKSILHDEKIIKDYQNIYKNDEYLKYGVEGVNLQKFLDRLKISEKINKNLYKINNNTFYFYLPCCLADSKIYNKVEKDIDITYFGTIENRPKLKILIDKLKQKGLNILSNKEGNYITPEECISYYNRSIITLHEQVGPVYLEYPVRLGEASYCRSKVFSIDEMELSNYSNNDEILPNYISSNSIDDIIEKIVKYIERYKNYEISDDDNYNYTYDYFSSKILEYSNIKII
jgi:hypothetical protein